MKIMPPVLLALMLGIISTTALAAECTSSFYCYGNTATSVVRVNTRPPPIPPPNHHVMQQRRQAQLALRNSPTPRIHIPPPTVTPAPRTVARVAPVPPTNRTVNRITLADCPNLSLQASRLESQAVIASQHNDRQRSVQLFQEAGKLRNQAARLNCR